MYVLDPCIVSSLMVLKHTSSKFFLFVLFLFFLLLLLCILLLCFLILLLCVLVVVLSSVVNVLIVLNICIVFSSSYNLSGSGSTTGADAAAVVWSA